MKTKSDTPSKTIYFLSWNLQSTAKDFYQETVGVITNTMDISGSLVLTYLVQIFNIYMWHKTEEQLAVFEDSEMAELSQHFNDLLLNASCKVESIQPEWDILKTHMLPVIKSTSKATYLDVNIWMH